MSVRGNGFTGKNDASDTFYSGPLRYTDPVTNKNLFGIREEDILRTEIAGKLRRMGYVPVQKRKGGKVKGIIYKAVDVVSFGGLSKVCGYLARSALGAPEDGGKSARDQGFLERIKKDCVQTYLNSVEDLAGGKILYRTATDKDKVTDGSGRNKGEPCKDRIEKFCMSILTDKLPEKGKGASGPDFMEIVHAAYREVNGKDGPGNQADGEPGIEERMEWQNKQKKQTVPAGKMTAVLYPLRDASFETQKAFLEYCRTQKTLENIIGASCIETILTGLQEAGPDRQIFPENDKAFLPDLLPVLNSLEEPDKNPGQKTRSEKEVSAGSGADAVENAKIADTIAKNITDEIIDEFYRTFYASDALLGLNIGSRTNKKFRELYSGDRKNPDGKAERTDISSGSVQGGGVKYDDKKKKLFLSALTSCYKDIHTLARQQIVDYVNSDNTLSPENDL